MVGFLLVWWGKVVFLMVWGHKVSWVLDVRDLSGRHTAGGLQIWEDQRQSGNVRLVVSLVCNVTGHETGELGGDARNAARVSDGPAPIKRIYPSYSSFCPGLPG